MAGKIEVLEQSKLLQSDGRLAPRPGLAQCVAVIIAPERWLAARLPDRQIIGGEQTAMPAPGHVKHRVVPAETLDRLGHEAAIPGAAGGLDLRLAIGARVLGLPEYPLVGVGQSRITEQSARGRYVAARQIHRSRGRPLDVEQMPDACDRGADRRHQGSHGARRRLPARARRAAGASRDRAAFAARHRRRRAPRRRAVRSLAPGRARVADRSRPWLPSVPHLDRRSPRPRPCRRCTG